jgi:hypothetical protein
MQVALSRQEIQKNMVGQLEECPSIRQEIGRQLLRRMIDESLGRTFSLHGNDLRLQLFEIVMWCAQVPEALHYLVEAVKQLEEDSLPTVRLELLLDEWYAVGLVSPEDWVVFRGALDDFMPTDLPELVRAATGYRISRAPARCTNAWHAYVYLVGANAAADGLPPSMVFLGLVAERLPSPVDQEVRLRTWRRAGRLGLTPTLNRACYQPELPGPAAQTTHLMVQFEADGLEQDQYVMSHWYQRDTGSWRPQKGEDKVVAAARLETEVEKLVADIEGLWPDAGGTMMIEFILPWELLNTPVDWWLKETQSSRPIPLTMDYPVVVRSLERLRTRRWHRGWRARWAHMPEHPPATQVYWSRPAGEDYQTLLETELKSDHRIALLVLSEPPHIGGAGQGEAEAALRAGLPVIIWHRLDCTERDFIDGVSELIGAGLAQLPERARELRRQALRVDPRMRDQHIGRHLTVLWDDPERQPEVSRSSNPPERGSSGEPGASQPS